MTLPHRVTLSTVRKPTLKIIPRLLIALEIRLTIWTATNTITVLYYTWQENCQIKLPFLYIDIFMEILHPNCQLSLGVCKNFLVLTITNATKKTCRTVLKLLSVIRVAIDYCFVSLFSEPGVIGSIPAPVHIFT